VTTKTRVLVLYGGRSAEHEISILSARFVAQALEPARFEVSLCGIDPEGVWRVQTAAMMPAGNDPRTVKIDPSGPRAWMTPVPEHGKGILHVENGSAVTFDVVFPVLHGPMGEDGTMQGLLELAGVAYVGAGVAASAVGMDKVLMKRLFADAEIPVLRWTSFVRSEWEGRRDACLERCSALGFPLFVKPAALGSSLGVGRADDAPGLARAVSEALRYDRKVLVEEGLVGVREIECAVLGNDAPRASQPGEIVVRHRDGFYSYDAKYVDDGADLVVPAKLGPSETNLVQLLALRAFRAIDCAGMARVDFFMTAAGDLYVNELNTIPGFTAISMYPAMWRASGVGSVELVAELVALALERHGERQALRTRR
jgi:D-alanine-D-alanine ligase